MLPEYSAQVLEEKAGTTYRRRKVPSQVNICWDRIVGWLDKNVAI